MKIKMERTLPVSSRREGPGPVPVTLVAGFFGSGKTTLLDQTISGRPGMGVLSLAADGSPMGVDAAPDEDIIDVLGRLMAAGRPNHLFIELDGDGEPLHVAEALVEATEEGDPLAGVVRLDRVVTVVDCRSFVADLQRAETFAVLPACDDDDERGVALVLAQQVEAADVVVLGHVDAVGASERAAVEARVAVLNPSAAVVAGPLGWEDTLQQGVFDMDQTMARPGWLVTLTADPPVEPSSSGLVFRARRPFHPTRLRDWLDAAWPGVVRAHGWFWVASRPHLTAELDLVCNAWESDATGVWFAALPPEERDAEPDLLEELEALWHPVFGDRRNELSVVGVGMDPDFIRAGFERALCTDDELALLADPSVVPHPFPWPEAPDAVSPD